MLKRSILDSIMRFVLSGTCAISFLTIPVQPLSAQDYCPPSDCCEQDPCCNGGSGFGKTALIIGGAAVVGGIAGAIAGRSSGHRGHDGDSGNDGERGARGPRGLPGTAGATGPTGATGATGPTGATGATGPSPFTPDIGNTLTFTPEILLAAPIAILAGSTVTTTPFVSSPDGTVTEGTSTEIVGPGSLVATSFSPINVLDPVFGTYHVGIQLTLSGVNNLSFTGLSTNALAEASRDGSITTTELSATADVTLSPASNSALQTDSAFTYSPLDVP